MHDGVAKGWGPGYIGLFHRQINYSVLKKKYLHNNNTMKMFNSTQSDYIRCTSLMYRLGKEQYIPISHIRCTMVHSQVSLRLN